MRKAVLLLLLSFIATGCESIKSSINWGDSKAPALVATCDGTSMSWDYCYDAAARLCPSGYQISDRQQTSDSPSIAYRTEVKRKMYFKCK